MSVYNRAKAADREREIADLTAEVAAIDAGLWPRTLDDEFRWGTRNLFYDAAEKAAHVRRLCWDQIGYLQGIQFRIEDGELPGWEA
jgi:hypothetical protein